MHSKVCELFFIDIDECIRTCVVSMGRFLREWNEFDQLGLDESSGVCADVWGMLMVEMLSYLTAHLKSF